LLKPISAERLAEAIARVRRRGPGQPATPPMSALRPPPGERGPAQRVLVRDGTKVHVIDVDDLDFVKGTRSRLRMGAELPRHEMLRLALMSSENRAAYALCRSYPRGLTACVRAMNAKAAELGMKTAYFVEPTGLSKLNVASPCDLAKLVLAAGEIPTIGKYSTAVEHTVHVGRQALQFRNTNSLVEKPDWQVGVQKTGYISEAGRCLVMQTVIDGRQVVIVLLNSFGKLTRIADAKRIRTWLETQHKTKAV
ncbi:MAG TPA: hypothetical protein VF055_01130, partial [Steroidobacteraceae bacterium]